MSFHPSIDGGIALKGTVEAEEFLFHDRWAIKEILKEHLLAGTILIAQKRGLSRGVQGGSSPGNHVGWAGGVRVVLDMAAAAHFLSQVGLLFEVG